MNALFLVNSFLDCRDDTKSCSVDGHYGIGMIVGGMAISAIGLGSKFGLIKTLPVLLRRRSELRKMGRRLERQLRDYGRETTEFDGVLEQQLEMQVQQQQQQNESERRERWSDVAVQVERHLGCHMRFSRIGSAG